MTTTTSQRHPQRLSFIIYHLSFSAALLLLLLCLPLAGANRIYSPQIKTLTSTVNGDWLNRPVMVLGSGDRLEVGFDELSHNYRRLVYRLEHCEPDWTVSDGLFESEWLEGFNDNLIDDYQNSINTTVVYTHYRLSIPNDRCRLTRSGNYRLTVVDDETDDGEEARRLQEVEFYVVEPLMDIGLEATTNTDIDHNAAHQQLSMTLNYNNVRVNNPDEELQTVVMQNWRDDQARRNLRPSSTTMRGLAWQHNRDLIFDGGNEYHKFEILDVSHPTMGIDRIEWDGSHYQAYPMAAAASQNYLTDVDADGAFCIRNSERSESDYTCEYVWVNYVLQAPYTGDVYIRGQWTTDAQRDHYCMHYDEAQAVYTASILQKQGYYNYRFATADGRSAASEGNYFQTQNRYQAMVYYRGAGERSWRLVGYRGVDVR
jgi:hypothetical protein